MTDRFRYLPCALHPALAIPIWAARNYNPDGKYAFIFRWSGLPDGEGFDAIDLAHPAGWDHAVRAFFTIRNIVVDESKSATFYTHRFIDDHTRVTIGIRVGGYKAGNHMDVDFIERVAKECRSPGGAELRREALCRCICAALNLDPDQVFPLEKA